MYMEFEIDKGTLATIAKLTSDTVDLTEVYSVSDPSEGPGSMTSPGLYYSQVNQANTVFLTVKITEEAFEVWSADSTLGMGISWIKMGQILGGVNDQQVRIELDDERRQLNFNSDSGFSYEMTLQSTEQLPEGDMPDLEYANRTETTIGDLHRVLESCELVEKGSAPGVHFEVEDGSLWGWSQGDTDEVRDKVTDVEGLDDVHTRLGITAVKNITSNIPNDSTTQVMYEYNGGRDERNYPMKINSTPFQGVEVEAVFAPRNKGQ
jgi:hypothetical protein